ncbi:hypothetical protein Syun_021022 [Stephania yunnanensis]|uniref:Uncharacterized protein n=1 Tax=Stephania yunnanensis TaxID=152371 RepID=A0AAP0IFL5_9MAGN
MSKATAASPNTTDTKPQTFKPPDPPIPSPQLLSTLPSDPILFPLSPTALHESLNFCTRRLPSSIHGTFC